MIKCLEQILANIGEFTMLFMLCECHPSVRATPPRCMHIVIWLFRLVSGNVVICGWFFVWIELSSFTLTVFNG